jgi:ketosteroid isomerase-like protein
LPLGGTGVSLSTLTFSHRLMRCFRLAALVALVACATPSTPRSAAGAGAPARAADRAADHAELLRLHELQRTAHLQRRADLLVAANADSMFSLSRGGVSIARRERSQASFQEYFDAVTFQAWDDIVPPRIRISADGQMAYVVVEKRVHLTPRTSSGAAEAERMRYAWLSVYEKQAGQWRLAAIASTERPDSP